MKKLVYSLGIAIFITGSVSATSVKEKTTNNNVVKIEKMETITKVINGKTVFYTRYRGRCLDGTTFTFSAGSRSEAQGFVNGYCAAIRSFAT